MDLFSHSSVRPEQQPLAERLRPQTFDDFAGEERIKGYAGSFKKLLDQGYVQNIILWGPPGCGKTTFAQLLKSRVDARYIELNAIDTGAKAIRQTGQESHRRRLELGEKTLVFVDEIHRLNKAQQDVFLPFIEKGDFILVGATTENPSYELNAALLSRCRLLVFSPHDHHTLCRLLDRACDLFAVERNGVFSEAAQEFLFQWADGDGRRLLNTVEPVLKLYTSSKEKLEGPIEPEQIEEMSGQKANYFDKKGDQHYDTISAFIKSLRGSDADAGLYYLARLLDGGEDPVFIARRLVILASEDIGNADPRALTVALAGFQAVEMIGLPECAINLAQIVTYLASAPKSNRSYVGWVQAQEEVRRSGQLPIPLALRSGKGRVLKELGYGVGYKYSHEGPKGYIAQDFLPEKLKDRVFYEPSSHGFEKTIQQYRDWQKKV